MDIEKLFKEIAPQVKEFEQNKCERAKIGFNVFYLISDYYYRETFHGDILYAILSPEEKHNEGSLFVDLFINMINKHKELIDINNYSKVIVKREYGTHDGTDAGRIDFVIFGENNHCIVVENKLNNAADTKHQLPKYNNDLKGKKHIIDAFVYMPLNPNKEPQKNDWEDYEKKEINPKLVIIPAYKSGEINLIDNWLTPAEQKVKSEDAKFVIKQYKTLLNNLTLDIMDNKELVNTLTNEENFDTTMAILENYQSICNRIIDDFVASLKIEVEKEHLGNFTKHSNQYIEIEVVPSWKYIIEWYSRNNMYNRFIIYGGEKSLPNDISKIWERPKDVFPFGWDYFDIGKGWSYWDNPNTLKDMRNGTFLKFIVDELKLSIERINQLNI